MNADKIITNARILTMDQNRPRADSLAISDGIVRIVGSREDVSELAGPETEEIDAGGASVLPGFNESHMHIFLGAAEIDHLQLFGVEGFEPLAAAVREYATARPEDAFLMAQGADYTVLSADEPVTRHHLDRILPDRPFAMVSPDHHTMWANTMALEAAGLIDGRELPPGNEIVMGADGKASGELRESEATAPLTELAGQARVRLGITTGGEPDPEPGELDRAADRAIMRRGLEHAASHGITSFQNMDGNFYQLALLAELESTGYLLCRAQVPFHFKKPMELGALEKAVRMAEAYDGDWLSSGRVKVFMDGVLDSWTALMVESYADRPDWSGEAFFEAEEFATLAVEIDRRGLQIAVHAIGDGAVRRVLDGYEAARRINGRRDSRHRIEHIELVTPDDIPRFAELGVLAAMQPPHPPGTMGLPLEPTVSRIGRDKWHLAYAWRTLADTGARLVLGSDWPVSPIDPIAGIHAAVTRARWADDLPDQSLTVEEAVAGYTIAGAYAQFMEDRKGALKPGYLADIVILDRDITSIDPDEIATASVMQTICGGRTTFAR